MSNEQSKSRKDVVGSVMVVGGGIAGIQASLDLAESGFKVYLLEEASAIGGHMAQLDKTFPTNDCSMCILSPKLVDVGANQNIELITNDELIKIDGEPGDFKIRVKKRPRFIDESKCTACGDCAKECPVEIPDEFNMGIGRRKAIYKLYPQGVPNAFTIEKKEEKSPCKVACPAGVNAQGYVALISQGKFKEAIELVREKNPFPGICGRVCHHPCETECMRGKVDEPVAIAALKRFAADYELNQGKQAEAKIGKPVINGKKVAIIGSGPAGLTAAYDLVLSGHQVTVFEKLPVAGGMMRVGIPDYRLPQKIIQAEIDTILSAGVELKLNAPVDSLDSLKAQGFDAILIAVGAHLNKRLDVPGEDLDGVLPGVDFLRKVNLGQEVKLKEKVAVVGGGNVAIDAARVAVRLGAKEVTIIYRRSRDEMPADPHEIEACQEEGVKIHFLANPTKIIGKDGKVVGVECIKMELGEPDESGRRRPVPIKGSEFIMDMDHIIPAIGQGSDLSLVEDDRQVKITPWGTIEVDAETLATSQEGVFAGGDVVLGPAFVVDAIAAGHAAAESISRYLRGEDLRQGREKLPTKVIKELPWEDIERIPRQRMAALEPKKRIARFDEVELGFTEEQAKAEAQRCLNCAICSECLQCVEVCKAEAVDHSQTEEELEIAVGGIILTPGFEPFDPVVYDTYGYGKHPNVVTSMEFERILSASGPNQGELLKPSDKTHPKKIAWLQCIGSRDQNRTDNKYCSAVCCTYAIKEAIIAKEHSKDELDTAIFFMDMRTFGKDFERYYRRAQEEYGVRFIRSRIHTIDPVGNDGNLRLVFADEDGQIKQEEFDMVVLSVGLEPSAKTKALAQRLGIELNQHGFCATSFFNPTATSRKGIYACGASSEPKDIPATVMDASGAVSCIGELLVQARGSQIVEKEYPPEMDVDGLPPRVGVFVCNCGINIGGYVDVPQVVEYVKNLPDVVHAEDNLYTCSQDTQEKIKQIIQEKELNRVVVASCTPRTHEPLFQDTCREAGLNKYLFEMANIRDQCSWVHQDVREAATEKAKDLVRSAIARARLLKPLKELKVDVISKALIVGGGLSGMVASLSLANQGFEVELIERETELGGNLRHVHFTTDGADPQKYLKSLIEQIENHRLINLHLQSRLKDVSGHLGHFVSEVKRPASGCPESEVRKVEHGVVIVATGGVESKPTEYLYGQDERVITQREMEEQIANPKSKIENLKSVVMIQCVGSRDKERPYCSRICCQQAVKNSLKIKEMNPEADIYILYRDIRTYGFQEEYYHQARQAGVIFIRYDEKQKPEVRSKKLEVRNEEIQNPKSKIQNQLEVRVFDPILQQEVILPADLVVLAAAIIPHSDNEELAKLLKVPINQDGFFLEAHAKLRPVDFATDGVFLCGLAHSPKSISESISQSNAAACHAAIPLSRGKVTVLPIAPLVDEDKCIGCGLCVSLCSAQAMELVLREEGRKAENIAASCKGCGVCGASCPQQAITIQHFTNDEIGAQIEALVGV